MPRGQQSVNRAAGTLVRGELLLHIGAMADEARCEGPQVVRELLTAEEYEKGVEAVGGGLAAYRTVGGCGARGPLHANGLSFSGAFELGWIA